LFTVPGDPADAPDPLKAGNGAETTFSWHPRTWDYAVTENGNEDLGKRAPGRVWERHPGDMTPKDGTYSIYLITSDPVKQRALESAIRSWIVGNNQNYECGAPVRRDPDNPRNDIGKRESHHVDQSPQTIYYSLLEQNCVWWATIMLLQNDIKLSKEVEKVISDFNHGQGAAKEVILGKRSANIVHRMSYIPDVSRIGGYGVDPNMAQ